MTRSERWILSEWRVARDRVGRLDERLVDHRLRTPYAEVDLLFRQPHGLVMIEVKSIVGDIWAPEVLRPRQLRRLMNAREYLESRYGLPVELWIAVPEAGPDQERVRYFEPPLLT